jgi:hypothetical protein
MNVPSIAHINVSFQNKRWRKGTFSRLEESHVTEHKAGDYSDIYIRVDFRLLEPAGLEKADIGVAMGIAGSELSWEAVGMNLLFKKALHSDDLLIAECLPSELCSSASSASSLLPGICLTPWSIQERKVDLVPLLYFIFTMQVMILIYTCCCS